MWPEKKDSDFLFPLFERSQKMSSLFGENLELGKKNHRHNTPYENHLRGNSKPPQRNIPSSQRKKCISKTSSNNPDIFCRIHSNRDKQLLRCGQTVEMPLLYEPAVTDLIRNSFNILLTLRSNEV